MGIRRAWPWMAATFVVTVAGLLLILNATLGDKQIDSPIGPVAPVGTEQFDRNMGWLLEPSFVEGNRIDTLRNGDEFFPAMLESIAGAKRSVCFETYVYWRGEIGRRFAAALIERARAGVRVKVMIDWWGGGDLLEETVDGMRRAGVDLRTYHPPRVSTLARLNNRTHRKLLVIDGRVAFTGGVGIADEWTGDAQDPRHWRDNEFRVEGPVVAQAQSAFADNWTAVTGEVLHGEDYFPALAPAGNARAQFFTSSAGGGAESAQLMFLLAIASARRSIRLSMAYFIPDEVAIAELVAARRRGVRVQIIVPGPYMDWQLLRRASRSRWGPLLRSGVEIHEYQPTMFHCKELVVDETWATVGSANFDSRSFAINDEANVNVYDREFAAAQVRMFEHDLSRSRRISLEEWEGRGVVDKLLDGAFALLGSQL